MKATANLQSSFEHPSSPRPTSTLFLPSCTRRIILWRNSAIDYSLHSKDVSPSWIGFRMTQELSIYRLNRSSSYRSFQQDSSQHYDFPEDSGSLLGETDPGNRSLGFDIWCLLETSCNITWVVKNESTIRHSDKLPKSLNKKSARNTWNLKIQRAEISMSSTTVKRQRWKENKAEIKSWEIPQGENNNLKMKSKITQSGGMGDPVIWIHKKKKRNKKCNNKK